MILQNRPNVLMPPPLPGKSMERAQPSSVQASCLTDAPARVEPPLTEVISDIPARAIITLTIEIEALTCAAVDLEKFIGRPGRVVWLRHYLGEAIRYVVGKDRGRQWSYLVKSGRVTWKAAR